MYAGSVGETVGDTVGETVGDVVGDTVGETDGETLGETVGDVLGAPVVATVGDVLGALVVGDRVGPEVPPEKQTHRTYRKLEHASVAANVGFAFDPTVATYVPVLSALPQESQFLPE